MTKIRCGLSFADGIPELQHREEACVMLVSGVRFGMVQGVQSLATSNVTNGIALWRVGLFTRRVRTGLALGRDHVGASRRTLVAPPLTLAQRNAYLLR